MENLYTFHKGYQQLLGVDIHGLDAGIAKIAGGINAKPMKEILSLTGKTAIVSGGAMGLGFCIVNRLCEAGANVVIADIAQEFAEKAVEFFDSKSYQVKYIKTDVRYPDQIQAAVDFSIKEFGKIDILVNAAAIWATNFMIDVNEESWDDIIDTNLKGTFFFAQSVARQMIKQGDGGKIINIASTAGLSMETSFGCMAQYVASKSGVIGISQSLSRELKPYGININCVAPGGMLTPGAMVMQTPPDIEELRNVSPTAPITDPDEVARVVFMLANEISDYMHGATVVVDGGSQWGIQK